ncbi:MAG: YkvA family protein, partial [Longimicrobiales bacterium]
MTPALRRRRRKRSARRSARALIRQLPQLVLLLVRLLRDPRVSAIDKGLFGLVIAYIITPLDLMPDFLGVIGMVDDLYLLGLALGRLLGRAGPDILIEHWTGNRRTLSALLDGVDHMGSLLPAPVR